MFLQIRNIFFCFAFAAFAYVNLNDRNAWLWLSVYLVASIFCGLAAFHKYFPILYLVAIVFYLYAARLFFIKDGVKDWIMKYRSPSLVESMRATKPYIGQTREFFGLVIISAALAMNYFVAM